MFARTRSIAVVLCALAGGATALASIAPAAMADERERWWHDDIHRFHEHDFDVWRRGHWFHGDHFGRFGWWWIVAGIWYFYPAPVYPYPDPYVPPTAVVPVTPTYYYWCAVPRGYYPQVAVCRVPWQAVPAVAPAVPAPPTQISPAVPPPPPTNGAPPPVPPGVTPPPG